MRYCQHCGKELLDDALICIGCGRVVQAQKTVKQNNVNNLQMLESESVAFQAENAIHINDNKWVVRLFSYFLSILSAVLYFCSRKYISVGAYVSFDIGLWIASFVLLSIGAILAITDIALTGVDVSKRKLSTSKLCSPIISLLLPVLLFFAFVFMR